MPRAPQGKANYDSKTRSGSIFRAVWSELSSTGREDKVQCPTWKSRDKERGSDGPVSPGAREEVTRV